MSNLPQTLTQETERNPGSRLSAFRLFVQDSFMHWTHLILNMTLNKAPVRPFLPPKE